MDGAYLAGSRALSAMLLAVGLVLVVSTLMRGGGPLAFGVVIGVVFTALGAARLRLARHVDADRGT